MSHELEKYFPDTRMLVEELLREPTTPLSCSHGGEPAVGVYEVPKGCVALPGIETQCLCPQHVLTDGSFEGMYLIVDLSVDAQWSLSDYCGQTPGFWMQRQKDTGLIVMRATVEYPLPSN